MMDFVTRDELYGYATMRDLCRVEEAATSSAVRVDSIQQELGWLRGDYGIALGTPDVCSNGGVGGVVGEKINRMEHEIAQIKEAIINVQDMLCGLGMDDVSQRLGDLNLLLT